MVNKCIKKFLNKAYSIIYIVWTRRPAADMTVLWLQPDSLVVTSQCISYSVWYSLQSTEYLWWKAIVKCTTGEGMSWQNWLNKSRAEQARLLMADCSVTYLPLEKMHLPQPLSTSAMPSQSHSISWHHNRNTKNFIVSVREWDHNYSESYGSAVEHNFISTCTMAKPWMFDTVYIKGN